MEVVDYALMLEQKKEMNALMDRKPMKGEFWFMVDCKWIKQWKRYVGYDHWDTGIVGDPSAYPGPIDNSFIMEDGLRIVKKNLLEEIDYTVVPKELWEKLMAWYKLSFDQMPIKCSVVEQGLFVKRAKVEIYLLELSLCCNFKMDNIIVKSFSHGATVESLVVQMRSIFHTSQDKQIRLWLSYGSTGYQVLNNKWDSTLQDASLYSGQVIVIEFQNDDGTYNRPILRATSNVSASSTAKAVDRTSSSVNTGTPKSLQSTSDSHKKAQNSGPLSYILNIQKNRFGPGQCGLSNLGNTCFMNAALQCMSNVPSLTEYMLEGRWSQELNKANPLGNGGEIARTYAELIKTMWSGNNSSTPPREFKTAVGHYKPEFSGYQPQDSHELLAFLLDGLHEDLNRIKDKPYIELKDANNRPDKEVASEVWTDYIKRNDSVIVDTFHGLLKSTLVCQQCEGVSVKFDPFVFLSLPLPSKAERQIEVTLVPSDPLSKLHKFKLTVSKTGKVYDLYAALSKLADIAPEKMVAVEVCNHRFQRIFKPDTSVINITNRDDIFIYAVPDNENGNLLLVPVYMREDKFAHCLTYGFNLFGLPLLVAVPKNGCTYDVLHRRVLDQMARYVCDSGTPGYGKPSLSNMVDKSDKERMNEAYNDWANHNTTSGSDEEQMDYKNDEGISDCKPSIKPVPLFTFHTVNSYGNAQFNTIPNDGEPINFSKHPYVAAHWKPSARHMFYDEKRAWDTDLHETMNMKEPPKEVQLTDCLELFTSKERLGEPNPWLCPNCKKPQQATKKFDLWQLPRVLVIHLKRFSSSQNGRDKLDMFVRFPVRELNMQKWVINTEHRPAIYDLIAVTNHMGQIGHGHYTACAKNKNNSKWYHFDDASVKPLTDDKVVTQAGYVLVYQMRTELEKAATFDNRPNCDRDVAMETS